MDNIFRFKKKGNKAEAPRTLGSVDNEKVIKFLDEMREQAAKYNITPGEDLLAASNYLLAVLTGLAILYKVDVKKLEKHLDETKQRLRHEVGSGKHDGVREAVSKKKNHKVRHIVVDENFNAAEAIAGIEEETGEEVPEELKKKLYEMEARQREMHGKMEAEKDKDSKDSTLH